MRRCWGGRETTYTLHLDDPAAYVMRSIFDRHNALSDLLADIIIEHVDEAIVFASSIEMTQKGLKQAYEQAALDVLGSPVRCRRGRDGLHQPTADHIYAE